MNAFHQDRFLVGTTFAPTALATDIPPSEWEKDVATMKALGLNIYRLFIGWDRIERQRGVYDFSRVDHSFRLAEKHGVKIIVSLAASGNDFPGPYAPRWLHREFNVSLRRSDPTAGNELTRNEYKLCYDDDVLRREFERFVRDVARRYKESPALAAWSPCNEVGPTAVCQCPHTLRRYRAFLQDKYGTLDALNAAWGTEHAMDFAGWDEAFPAASAGFCEGGYRAFLDYREFQAKERDWIFNLHAGWIKAEDPSHPVVVHLIDPRYSDAGLEGDIAGASTYFLWLMKGKRGELPPERLTQQWNFVTACFGLNSAPWRRDRHGYWQVESEGGPLYWCHHLLPHSFPARTMNARDMIFVASGARCLMRWMYRSRQTDSQAGEFNLVGWDGSVLERSRLYGDLAKTLNAHRDVFLAHEPEPYRAAILFVDGEVYQRWEMEDVDRYEASYRNLFSAICDAGVRPRFLSSRQLERGELDGLKVLFIPFRPWLSAQAADVLRRFVAEGGRLVVDAPFATKDMGGVHQLVTPGFGLTEVFGCKIVDMDKVREDTCGTLPCLDFRAAVTPQGCEVELTFADGAPAVVTHRYGKGATRLYASLVFERFSTENAAIYRAELGRILDWAGVGPQYRVDGLSDLARLCLTVYPRRLPDGRRIVFLVNLGEARADFRLDIADTPAFETLCDSGDARYDAGACSLGPQSWLVLIAPAPCQA